MSIRTQINRIINAKNAIASAISAKGVTVPSGAKIDEMAPLISQISQGITPIGTKQITANGTYDVTQYASANVNVPAPAPRLQAKTATANGTVTADSGYDGLSSVTVAIPVYTGW